MTKRITSHDLEFAGMVLSKAIKATQPKENHGQQKLVIDSDAQGVRLSIVSNTRGQDKKFLSDYMPKRELYSQMKTMIRTIHATQALVSDFSDYSPLVTMLDKTYEERIQQRWVEGKEIQARQSRNK